MSYRDGHPAQRDEETVWIEVEVFHTTDKAILIDEGPGAQTKWVAKSQVKDWSADPNRDRLEDLERRDKVKIEVSAWYFNTAGLDAWHCEKP